MGRGRLRGWLLEALNELLEAGFEGALAGFGQIDEAEGLEPSLGRPHGEHHLGFLADGGFADVEDQFDFEFLVEGFFEMHQAAGGGKLVKFASYFAAVGKAHEGEDGSAELDAKRAVLAAGCSGGRGARRNRIWGLRHRG